MQVLMPAPGLVIRELPQNVLETRRRGLEPASQGRLQNVLHGVEVVATTRLPQRGQVDHRPESLRESRLEAPRENFR